MLTATGPLYLLGFVSWFFTMMPERYLQTAPLVAGTLVDFFAARQMGLAF